MGFTPRVAPAGSADRPGARWPARLEPLVWLAPALLTLAITAVQAGRAQLWRDELATWSAASRPLPDLARLVGNIDAVSGPYYLFMHGWIAVFGDSVLALRSPSILAMTAAAGVAAALGRRLSGPRTGLIAGLLFAVVPSTSRYAQEARSYAVTTLLAVLATLLLVRALDHPVWRRWAGYAVAVLGLGLAHLMSLGLVAAHAVAVLLTWRRTGDRRMATRWLAVTVPAAIALTPLALIGRGQQTDQLGWVGKPWIGDLDSLPGAVTQSAQVGGVLVGLALLGVITWPRGSTAAPPHGSTAGSSRRSEASGSTGGDNASGSTGDGGTGGGGARVASAARADWGLVLGLSLLLPTVLMFIGGQLSPLWVPRYLVCTVPFGCLLAAGPLARLRLGAALPIVALVAFLGSSDQVWLRRTHDWPRTAPIDYRAASRIVAANQRPGDGIVYAPRGKLLDTSVAYNLRAQRPRDVLMTRDQISRGDLRATECKKPARCLASVSRVWLLAVGQQPDPLVGMRNAKAAALRDGFTVSRRWSVPGLTVVLLTRRSR